jgi:hypothetical protein
MGKIGLADWICTAMDGPYRLHWQVLLSYDTRAIPASAAAGKLVSYYNLTSSLKPDTSGGVIIL